MRFREQVHDALVHLHDPSHLQRHPLASLARAAGSPAREDSGRALRRALVEAIEGLAPTGRRGPDPQAARRHRILVERYLEGRVIDEIRGELAVGRSHYFREHAAAVDGVAALLEERWTAGPGGHGERGERGGVGGPRGRSLPRPSTSFVGRESEIGEVVGLLGGTRLVTLTGPAGTGKTRLAVEVAARLGSLAPAGRWWVELAELPAGLADEPGPVLGTIARSLLAPGGGDLPLERLAALIGDGRVLLVLDNCEHVSAAAAAAATALLAECAELRILATSRGALRVSGEQERPLGPLVLPADTRAPVDQLLAYPAVRLFLERARAVRPDLAATSENVSAAAEICRRVDGLPLGIELAAARTRELSPQAIGARLGERLALLSDGPRDLPGRQRSLRAALVWSCTLLSPREQAIFRRLSVFVGGCGLEAAEEVAGADLAAVTALLAQALISRSDDAEPRYVMLETVAELGREMLDGAGETETARRAHAGHFAELAAMAESDILGAERERWMARFDAELANIRAALAWCVGTGDTRIGLRLAASLIWFWHDRGHIAEAHEVVGQLLSAEQRRTAADPASAAPPSILAAALHAAALLGVWRGDPAARALAEQAVAAWGEIGDGRRTAWAMHTLAHTLGQREAERDLLSRSVDDFRVTSDAMGLAWSLFCLGNSLAMLGELDRARACHEEALALGEHSGSRWAVHGALSGLATVAARAGDHARAYEIGRQALDLLRETGDRSVWDDLITLGHAALGLGDQALAEAHFRECLEQTTEQGLPWEAALALLGLAEVALCDGSPGLAVTRCSASTSLLARLGRTLPDEEQARLDRAVAAARSELDEATCRAAWEAGAAASLRLRDAVALGLAESAGGDRGDPASLTPIVQIDPVPPVSRRSQGDLRPAGGDPDDAVA